MIWLPDIFGVRAAHQAVAEARQEVQAAKDLVSSLMPLVTAVSACKAKVTSSNHVEIPADQWLRVLTVIADHKAKP